jgi:hypothetical protein
MKLSWCRPRLLLSAAVAVGVLAGLTVAAAPAYAAGPQISVIGGPGEILVQGGGFNAGASVRIEALTPDLSKVLDTIYVTANWIGYLDDATYLNGFGGYTGKVAVAADGAPGPTAWASTQVSAAPVIVANNDTQYGCYGVVSVYGYNFEPGSTVRIELLSGDLQTVMDTIYTIATGRGAVQYGLFTPLAMNLTPGYHGPVWVVADEYYPYGQTTWAGLSSVC